MSVSTSTVSSKRLPEFQTLRIREQIMTRQRVRVLEKKKVYCSSRAFCNLNVGDAHLTYMCHSVLRDISFNLNGTPCSCINDHRLLFKITHYGKLLFYRRIGSEHSLDLPPRILGTKKRIKRRTKKSWTLSAYFDLVLLARLTK